ncbi:DNA-deoxyinosine glycosylase [Dysgonomonas sp. Marseille-P4361]|uniref:DNA-deoxyinosine glycosylase n=1 Tax=Dysgonomonas sp. Marseille-P4361 TaxID=2161820 RepID=UPI000D54B91B|nr:DNA-deoxyinosine glycosylase [Dysgonomonas sp. Marseille-P4361]
MKKQGFAPIVNENSTVLILGTIPSLESLRKQERYGHKYNQFWKILFTLFGKPLPDNYSEKNALLIENNIAIWDVLDSCEGEGSLDSNIRNEKPNDFETFFKEYPRIKHIFFTGQKAAQLYKKHIGFNSDKTYTTLPSPSPANARMTLEKKTEEWKVILQAVKNQQ